MKQKTCAACERSYGGKLMNNALLSSDKNYWETPQDFFNKLNEKYHFTFDLAASDSNAKCKSYFTETDNSLSQDWHRISGNLFLNPPYGRDGRINGRMIQSLYPLRL